MAQRLDFNYDPETGRIIPPEYVHPDVIGLTDGYEAWDDVPVITINGKPMKEWDPLSTKNKTGSIPGIPGIGGLTLPDMFSPNWWLLMAAAVVSLAAFGASLQRG